MNAQTKTCLVLVFGVFLGVGATLLAQNVEADTKEVYVKPLSEADVFSLAKGNAKVHLLVGAATGAKEGALSFVESKPGWAVPEHVHANSGEFLYFLEGSGAMVVDGKTYQVDKNSAVYIPKGKKHSFTAGKKGLKAIQFYAASGPEERFRKIGKPLKH